MVQISQTDLDHLIRLQSPSTGFQTTHTSSLGMDIYTAYPTHLRVIDFGTSPLMSVSKINSMH